MKKRTQKKQFSFFVFWAVATLTLAAAIFAFQTPAGYLKNAVIVNDAEDNDIPLPAYPIQSDGSVRALEGTSTIPPAGLDRGQTRPCSGDPSSNCQPWPTFSGIFAPIIGGQNRLLDVISDTKLRGQNDVIGFINNTPGTYTTPSWVGGGTGGTGGTGGSDLAVTAQSVRTSDGSADFTLGKSLIFTATIQNNGTAASGASSTATLFLDKDTPSAQVLTATTATLAANETANVTWTRPNISMDGPHTYEIAADTGSTITELDEANNSSGTQTFTILPFIQFEHSTTPGYYQYPNDTPESIIMISPKNNTRTGVQDSVSVQVKSQIDSTGYTVTLKEGTSPGSTTVYDGVFSGVTTPSYAATDPAQGRIQVKFCGTDQLTATWSGDARTTTILNSRGPSDACLKRTNATAAFLAGTDQELLRFTLKDGPSNSQASLKRLAVTSTAGTTAALANFRNLKLVSDNGTTLATVSGFDSYKKALFTLASPLPINSGAEKTYRVLGYMACGTGRADFRIKSDGPAEYPVELSTGPTPPATLEAMNFYTEGLRDVPPCTAPTRPDFIIDGPVTIETDDTPPSTDPTQFVREKNFILKVRVKNTGAATTITSAVKLLLDGGAGCGLNQCEFTTNVNGLTNNGTANLSWTIQNLPDGLHTHQIRVDHNNTVAELNENNNTTPAASFTVLPKIQFEKATYFPESKAKILLSYSGGNRDPGKTETVLVHVNSDVTTRAMDIELVEVGDDGKKAVNTGKFIRESSLSSTQSTDPDYQSTTSSDPNVITDRGRIQVKHCELDHLTATLGTATAQAAVEQPCYKRIDVERTRLGTGIQKLHTFTVKPGADRNTTSLPRVTMIKSPDMTAADNKFTAFKLVEGTGQPGASNVKAETSSINSSKKIPFLYTTPIAIPAEGKTLSVWATVLGCETGTNADFWISEGGSGTNRDNLVSENGTAQPNVGFNNTQATRDMPLCGAATGGTGSGGSGTGGVGGGFGSDTGSRGATTYPSLLHFDNVPVLNPLNQPASVLGSFISVAEAQTNFGQEGFTLDFGPRPKDPVFSFDDFYIYGNSAREPGNLYMNGELYVYGEKISIRGKVLTASEDSLNSAAPIQIGPMPSWFDQGQPLLNVFGPAQMEDLTVAFGNISVPNGSVKAKSIGKHNQRSPNWTDVTNTNWNGLDIGCSAGEELVSCNAAFANSSGAEGDMPTTGAWFTRISNGKCVAKARKTLGGDMTPTNPNFNVKPVAVCFDPLGR